MITFPRSVNAITLFITIMYQKSHKKAKRSNFAQSDEKLTEQLNQSPELASQF